MEIAIALAVLAVLAVLAILAGAYLRYRLPAATLEFSSVTDKTQEARTHGWTVHKTVVFEDSQLIQFRIRRGRKGLKIHSVIQNSDISPFDSVNPMPVRRTCRTMQAGIAITWRPGCEERALRRTRSRIPV
jgi:hypothetical protein